MFMPCCTGTHSFTHLFSFLLSPWPGNVQWEIQALQKRRMPILCLWKWFALREPIQTTRRSTFSAAMTPAVSLGPELSTLTRSAALEKEIVWKLSESKEKSLETTLLRDSSQRAVADYERWKRLFILKVICWIQYKWLTWKIFFHPLHNALWWWRLLCNENLKVYVERKLFMLIKGMQAPNTSKKNQ